VHPAVLASSLVGAAVILAWRVRETKTPVTAPKILIPPLAMSTGFLMFVAPPMRVPWTWGACAFLAGALFFAYPLVRTSELTRVGDVVMLRRSKAFLWILLGLFAVRLVLRTYLDDLISPMQSAAVFFVLAFGMILPWRVSMYRRYRELVAAPPDGEGERA
jgi:membrane protein CcdC involved in cytochrome C biogenesis